MVFDVVKIVLVVKGKNEEVNSFDLLEEWFWCWVVYLFGVFVI